MKIQTKNFLKLLIAVLLVLICGKTNAGNNVTRGSLFYNKYSEPCDTIIDQKFEGSAWKFQSSNTVKLNALGYVMQITAYDSNEKWQYKYMATRDAGNRLTIAVLYANNSGTPVKIGELLPVYNAAGLVIQETDSLKDRNTYIYDSNGNMILNTYLKYNAVNSKYENSRFDSLYYNSQNLMIKNNIYYWSGSAWVFSNVIEDSYNSNNKISHEKRTTVGSTGLHLDDYTYNTVGNEILLVSQNNNSGSLQYSSKDTITYDANGEVIFKTTFTYNNGNWIQGVRTGCGANANPAVPAAPDSLTIIPVHNKTGDGILTLSWKDNSGNETGFRIYRSIDGITFSEADSVGENVVTFKDTTLDGATKYYYKVLAYNASGVSAFSNVAFATTFSGIAGPVSNDLSFAVFPNPSNSTIYLNNSGTSEMVNISIVNMQGMIVFFKEMQVSEKALVTIEIPDLQNGIYFLKADNNKRSFNQRIIILK